MSAPAEAHIDGLRSSVARLAEVASAVPDDELTRPAYPSEWSVADVLSHLGSGAVIMRRRLEDALSGAATPDEFASGVWDSWNTKAPSAQRDDALAADAALLTRLEAVPLAEREEFSFAMGPMTLGFEAFVGMRVNEHAFHTWDVEVARDPAATIPAQVAELVVDNLELIARFTGRPTGDTTTVTVATTQPHRGFTVDLQPSSVTFSPGPVPERADVELPAEAFARLVYGRLDPAHTPAGNHGSALDVLRRVFPGP
jgi:uncharacterized protein (TIGR03083 family)